MKRRDFIQKASAAAVLFGGLPVFDLFAFGDNPNALATIPHSQVDSLVQQKFVEVLQWMKTNGWEKYIVNELKAANSVNDSTDPNQFQKEIGNLPALKAQPGLEDFGGNKLIEPGSPSRSLLYHLLASPRVKSELVNYPKLEHLDHLEDYIYSLKEWKKSDNAMLMVLAYEYRPAYKAPPFEPKYRTGKEFAQILFSRTGVARIGTHGQNFHNESRSFTNKPQEAGAEKAVAVMPARYGLFWVELVEEKSGKVSLMNKRPREIVKGKARCFINPIRKVFDTESVKVEFGEYHMNEKLTKLAEYSYKGNGIEFDQEYDFSKPPFTRISSTNSKGATLPGHATDIKFVQLDKVGSSVLVSSLPRPLIRKLTVGDHKVSIKVPPMFEERNFHSNRRHSALKLPNEDGHEATGLAMSTVANQFDRGYSTFRAPKIAPLFLNIKFQIEPKQLGFAPGTERHIDGITEGPAFEGKINAGGYHALLFEDTICDGCISAKVSSESGTEVVAAFSLVTAPDFFPLMDSNDIRAYYKANRGVKTDSDFMEGGTLNLSEIRKRGNPHLIDPFTKKPAFPPTWEEDPSFETLTAVISNEGVPSRVKPKEEGPYELIYKRDFESTSYLPDTGTGVFFPGWDVTYSIDEDGDPHNKSDSYLATYSLGAPFPEDMKLCAAANGMWPVTSPDAGRTFQGSLDKMVGLQPNTSLPLMDTEIGLNKYSPYVKFFNEKESYGWDGEQGPFLEMRKSGNQDFVAINFTDIGRADYLQNLLDENIGFDMSKLRELKSAELIDRMDCLRKCIRNLDHKKVWKTKLWLVGAEKVDDWSESQTLKSLPKGSLFDGMDLGERKNPKLEGEGYFYSFIRVEKNKEDEKGEFDEKDINAKRRFMRCKQIWLCQVTSSALSFIEINGRTMKPKSWVSKSFKTAK